MSTQQTGADEQATGNRQLRMPVAGCLFPVRQVLFPWILFSRHAYAGAAF
jgi:hypothetical protein